jgi:plastocyanin
MNRLRLPVLRSLIVTALVLLPVALKADDDRNKRTSVTVAFGTGLNTAGAANHHVLPTTIDVKAGGVVNFVVAGFHQIFVYLPGTTPGDIVVPAFPPNLFINDFANLYYMGINPANAANPTGANPATPANPAILSNLQNRVEPVAFQEPGLYLVICNVTPHFQNGMIAFVKVSN